MTDALNVLIAKYGLGQPRGCVEIPGLDRDPGLARLFHELGYHRGAEIGVEQGLFSEALCRENPGLELTCVDAWKAYRGYRDHVDQQKLDRFYAAAQERLAPYHATFIRKFSLEAVREFHDESLDFVYIDAAHDLQNCINDIAEWSKKVRVGGIVAGHDFARFKLPNQIQVVQAVTAWTDAKEISPWFLCGTQSKADYPNRDRARSWFWVKAEPIVYSGKIKQ